MTDVGMAAAPFARLDAWPPERTVPATAPSVQLTAVADLFQRHRLFHVRLAYLLVGDRDTAEDVVQDAFAAIYRRFGDHVQNVDSVLGYLRTAVLNSARDTLRRRKTAEKYLPAPAADAASAEVEALESEERRRVAEAMRELPSRQREVVVLRYWAGLSEAEIAAAMGISKGTVKSTASRALAALKRIMEADK